MVFKVSFTKKFEAADPEEVKSQLSDYLLHCVREIDLRDFSVDRVASREDFYGAWEDEHGKK